MGELNRVVIADFISDSLDIERKVLAGVATVEALGAQSERDFEGRIENADAIMMYHNVAITRPTIERLSDCKLIVRCGVGYDNVDWAFARTRGIPVCNVPDYGAEEVADSAIGMALSLTRGISYLNSRLRAGHGPWLYTQVAPLYRLRGRTFGIVGLGCIGAAAAQRAKALGMNVVFYDPYKQDGYDKALGIERVETLEELLRRSFVVSLHCPLTLETHHLINRSTLEFMSHGSYLVNTSRGGVVDVSAIPDAIQSGRLAGAAIDVLVDEPPAEDNALLKAWRDPSHSAHDRLIVNPHSAFYCEEGLTEMRVKGAEACRRAILGLSLRNIVNA